MRRYLMSVLMVCAMSIGALAAPPPPPPPPSPDVAKVIRGYDGLYYYGQYAYWIRTKYRVALDEVFEETRSGAYEKGNATYAEYRPLEYQFSSDRPWGYERSELEKICVKDVDADSDSDIEEMMRMSSDEFKEWVTEQNQKKCFWRLRRLSIKHYSYDEAGKLFTFEGNFLKDTFDVDRIIAFAEEQGLPKQYSESNEVIDFTGYSDPVGYFKQNVIRTQFADSRSCAQLDTLVSNFVVPAREPIIFSGSENSEVTPPQPPFPHGVWSDVKVRGLQNGAHVIAEYGAPAGTGIGAEIINHFEPVTKTCFQSDSTPR